VLFEFDVVSAVCAELETRGYDIRQRLRTTERGDDVIAVRQAAPVRERAVVATGSHSVALR